MAQNISTDNLLDLQQTLAADIFKNTRHPWEVLPRIESFIVELTQKLPEGFTEIQKNVWVGQGTTIAPSACIQGPAIIGHNCDIRHAAFVRDNVIIGNNVVVGNSTEIKNAILFNGVQVPHFNYIGDSVMGYKSHLGAGVILSNFKSTADLIKVKTDNGYIETGLLKFGAIIGDLAEVGCNSVLNPGTILGRECIIYPLTSVRGIVPEKTIIKNNGEAITRH